MKKIIFIIGIFVAATSYAKGGGNVAVAGYVRHDGTYVQPHIRTAADDTKLNNWSHVGNVNPYTGKAGTISDSSPNHGRAATTGYYYSGGGTSVYSGDGIRMHDTRASSDFNH